jgi:hypothetical protein
LGISEFSNANKFSRNSETSKCPKKNKQKKVYSIKFLARIQKTNEKKNTFVVGCGERS